MIATTIPLRSPDRPELGAAVLGISKQVIDQHYNRAEQVRAASEYNSILDGQMQELCQK
jgi:hypothetical protein